MSRYQIVYTKKSKYNLPVHVFDCFESKEVAIQEFNKYKESTNLDLSEYEFMVVNCDDWRDCEYIE